MSFSTTLRQFCLVTYFGRRAMDKLLGPFPTQKGTLHIVGFVTRCKPPPSTLGCLLPDPSFLYLYILYNLQSITAKMDDLLSQPSFIILFAALLSLGLWRFSAIFSTSRIESFPRVGPKPGAANNKRFLTASKQIIEDGYSKVILKSLMFTVQC